MTEFAETNLLLAALRDDEQEVESLIKDFLPGERQEMLRVLSLIERHITNRCEVCDEYIEDLIDRVSTLVNGLGQPGVVHHRNCELPPRHG